MTYIPPPAPPENLGMRAKDLKNLYVIVHSTGVGTNPDGREGPYEFISCDIWVFDQNGIAKDMDGQDFKGTDVQVTWFAVRDQLKKIGIGNWTAGRFKEEGTRVVLESIADKPKALEVAQRLIGELAGANGSAPAADDDMSEPF